MTNEWLPPPPQLDLSFDGVHVWRSNLELPPQPIADLLELLSPDERERADRFVRPVDRNSFIAARGILRRLLGGYLNLAPERVEFGYAERGKPFLVEGDLTPSLEFNLSHSGGFALYAIACHRRVGIDVEFCRDLDVLPLAERFFSDREYQQLCSYSSGQQQGAFYSIWTAKEALLKATGEGLMGLSQIEIALTGDDFIPSEYSMESSPSEWNLQRLELGSGYKAAVAIEGKPCPILCYTYH